MDFRKKGLSFPLSIASHLGRLFIVVLVFSHIFYGLKPFVTFIFLVVIGPELDLGTMGPVPTLLALPISISYLVISFWGAWMVNKLMSKNHNMPIRTHVIFWLVLVVSVIGSLSKMFISMIN